MDGKVAVFSGRVPGELPALRGGVVVSVGLTQRATRLLWGQEAPLKKHDVGFILVFLLFLPQEHRTVLPTSPGTAVRELQSGNSSSGTNVREQQFGNYSLGTTVWELQCLPHCEGAVLPLSFLCYANLFKTSIFFSNDENCLFLF